MRKQAGYGNPAYRGLEMCADGRPERRFRPCHEFSGGNMKKYVCDVCGYVYDPEIGDADNGVSAGTAFADLPDDWVCPECGVGKDDFSEQE